MTSTETRPFTERVQEFQVGSCRLFVLPTAVEGVVTWHGSFVSNPAFDRGEELIQSLTTALLDKGTQKRDRFEIADLLENRGAKVAFHSNVLRVGIRGKALSEDVATVMDVMFEQLREPLFAAEEFEKARLRLQASVQRSMDESNIRAWLSLCQQMYTPAHPNYALSPEDELARLEAASVAEVKSYYAGHFSPQEFILVVVGDISPEKVIQIVARHATDWKADETPARYDTEAQFRPPARINIDMPDKYNIDVRMGHPIAIRRDDPIYTTLRIANFILGGNFSSRLMDVVRDQKGLTYGVHSQLSNVNRFYQGHWQVNIALSQDKLDAGIEATLEVLRDFARNGVTAEELEEKKRTMKGMFTVQLDTTEGLSSTIRNSIQNGFDVGYLDSFADRIDAVELDTLNEAIATHFDPEKLHIMAAGTMPADVD